MRARDARALREVVVEAADTPTIRIAEAELIGGARGLTSSALVRQPRIDRDSAVLLTETGPQTLGPEGYLIRSEIIGGRRAIRISANSDIGLLYGVFRLLRQVQTGGRLDHLDISSRPKLALRLLDHWDNLDGSVERGYAGRSLWDWGALPGRLDPLYAQYARADASVGINGAVLNNVNADARSLTEPYLEKAAALAKVFRPYGVRVYLSARFSAPIELDHLKTADPLDPDVQAWWKAKADEIYRLIPDFGGFLVKANSEGQPGPQDYGRTHADGANMLADALAPHGGVVIWRAFVYSDKTPDDRAKQAYDEFKPLDGRFRRNVMLQVKNGPIDFQPREPFHPLFGAMPKTPLMMEAEITKEYLGRNTHLVYLGPLWEEVLRSDTYAKGPGTTVAKVLEDGPGLTGMAGVADAGRDADWTGSIFDQANWYAFGRLAWDPQASSRDIARDWVRMTFTNDPRFVRPVVGMMMGSREAAVDYMTPLGLHHQMARDTHYGPGPWVAGGPRADWTSVYFNKADPDGVGFDRTATGSDALAQYFPPAAAKFASLGPGSEKWLLWFHHLPWGYRMASGRTLWDALVIHYFRGTAYVAGMRRTWAALKGYVDPERYADIAGKLEIQQREADWWRDASIAYFQTFSRRPLPPGYPEPPHPAAYYESRTTPPPDDSGAGERHSGWVLSWMSSQQVPEPQNALDPADLTDATLRETVPLSVGGDRLRVRLSNVFGTQTLRLSSVHVALAAAPGSPAIRLGTDRALSFGGGPEAVIPAGGEIWSDPAPLDAPPLSDLAISLHFDRPPAGETSHPGSRTNSWLVHGDRTSAADLSDGRKVQHWFQASGVEVRTSAWPRGAVVTLGDSITDGRGSTTDGDDRWPDQLARRLQRTDGLKGVGVANAGIGGNRVLADGLGPSALARLDRDVLSEPGVTAVIVLEGINDLGVLDRAGPSDRTRRTMVARLEEADARIIAAAHARGIKVIGGTLTPDGGTQTYPTAPADEAERQQLNAWIRTPGRFDAVADFDAALRDPGHPDRLQPSFDSGDHLHPSPAGYRAMAEAVPLAALAGASHFMAVTIARSRRSRPAAAMRGRCRSKGAGRRPSRPPPRIGIRTSGGR
jgi:alpha-glucuronidase